MVNLILIYALYLHFIQGQRQPEISWLLGVFTTEILGCFVYGWHKIFAEKNDNESEPKKVDKDIKVVENGINSTPVSKLKLPRNVNDPFYSFYVQGENYLNSARATSDITIQIAFAQKAIEEFSKILETSSLYFSAIYNLGTAYKWRTDYLQALEWFEKAKNFLAEKGNLQFSPREINIGYMGAENMIGRVYLEMEQYSVAEKYFRKSWSYDHNYFMPLNSLFDSAFKQGDVGTASNLKSQMETYEEYASVAELVEIKMNILHGKYLRKVA